MRNVLIVGGGRIGSYLTGLLLEGGWGFEGDGASAAC